MFKYYKLSNLFIFSFQSIFMIIYYFCFDWLRMQVKTRPLIQEESENSDEQQQDWINNSEQWKKTINTKELEIDLLDLVDVKSEDDNSISSELENEPLTVSSLLNLLPRCKILLLNAIVGYYLHYTINTSFANVMDYKIKL